MTADEKIYYDHVVDAIERLWNWLDLQERGAMDMPPGSVTPVQYVARKAGVDVCVLIRAEMRTLFAGLINFDEE